MKTSQHPGRLRAGASRAATSGLTGAALGAVWAATLAALSAGAAAQPRDTVTAADDRGFSYFMGLGRQTVRHREMPSIVAARSRAEVSSPLLNTGALYAIDADNLLSLDAETTFAPGTTTERWTSTSGSMGPVQLSSPLLQTNLFSLHQARTRVLAQHRLWGPWFAVGGASFHSHSFKRFRFAAGPDNAVTLPPGTVEETVSEVQLNAGLALESESVRNSRHHYSARLTLGKPVWRRVENTAFADHRFGGTGGWDVVAAGRYSLAVRPAFHVGAWGQLAQNVRQRQIKGAVELPRSQTQTLSGGLEVLWKL